MYNIKSALAWKIENYVSGCKNSIRLQFKATDEKERIQ